jgi:hypothetical protein
MFLPRRHQYFMLNILSLRRFSVEITVTYEDSALSSHLAPLVASWGPLGDRVSAQRPYRICSLQHGRYAISTENLQGMEFDTRQSMLDFLEGDIELFVAEHATPYLFVHAGVVALNGVAILLPGRSFAGKSTLVTSLVNAGATYYSDEYAVLDADGRVLPYPRKVSLRDGPHGPAGRLDLSRRAPDEDAARRPISVGLVALLRYDEAAGWNVTDLGYLPAIMAMAEQTVAIQRRPRDAMEILGKVARSARILEGTRDECDTAARRLLELLGRDGMQTRRRIGSLPGSMQI